MSVNFLSNIKRNQMKKIKNFAKKLFSAKRMKTLAMLLFCGTLATYAQNAAGDYTAGTDALATVTEEIAKYVPFVVKLCYAIAGVVAVVGAISVYIAMNNEEQDVKKKIMIKPPTIKLYSVTSFIWEHPDLFKEYKYGMKESALVHKVCQRLLNIPVEHRSQDVHNPTVSSKPFDINDYKIDRFNPKDLESQKPFYAFFKSRGIDFATRCAFHHSFFLASKTAKDGSTYKNLSFPMYIPGQPDKCVGLEERGYPRKDGSARKGMATGTNASEGLWMVSPKNTALQDARIVLVFESAYDAMAFYQLQMRKESGLDQRGRQDLKAGVYVSTGGNPSYGQIQGLLKAAPQATFHLGFDKDVAGKQFVANFEDIASKQSPVAPGNVPADMRDFMESFDKQPKTIKELLSFNDENYSLLPHELKQLYLVYDSAKEEALEYHYSPFLCKEDKQEAADKMNKAFRDFKDALLQKLNLHEDQDLAPVKIILEEPSEGYKDFNDELLDKKQFSMTDVVETAFDENGVDLTIERQEENEETKHHGFKR